MKYLFVLLSFIYINCIPNVTPTHTPTHKHSKPSLKINSPFDNCKFETVLSSPNLVSVAFFKDCGTTGVNLFALIVFDAQSMNLAGAAAAKIIHERLGYTPILALVIRTMIADKYGVMFPFIVFIQTGREVKP